jgi:hypothetical protein
MKYIAANAGYKAPVGEEGAVFGSDTTMPTVSTLSSLYPAVPTIQWEDSLVGTEMAKLNPGQTIDLDTIKKYYSDYYPDWIDQQLAGVYKDPAGTTYGHGVDGTAYDQTYAYADIECLDRMISNGTESGATNHVNADTDGDIYWTNTNSSNTTAKIDRSAVTWANAQVKLPSTAGTEEAYNILDELDDLMAVALSYAPTAERNYIGLCGPKAFNKIQNELDPKATFLEGETEVTQTLNGVSTRPGVVGGKLSVASLMICGIKVPFFTSPYLGGCATSSWKWINMKYTTGGVGNIYLINMDNIEIRHLIPITYETWPSHTEVQPGLGNRHIIYSAMTLICRNFASHAALKYIKA